MGKVLVVEDDAFSRDILKTRLERAGHTVFEAINGEEGVHAAGKLKPDVIILDAMMPKVDGWLACRMLKSNDSPAKAIPVIMLTARGQQIDEMRGWEAGADEYLTKPCDYQRLIDTIARLLAVVEERK